MNINILFLHFILISNIIFAKENSQKTINTRLEKEYSQWLLHMPHFSGVILIERNNNRLFSKSKGFLDIKKKNKITEKTIFPIASMTKQFIAAAILQLAEQNIFSLHQQLPPIPGLPASEFSLYLAPEIRLHDILTHTSGLPRDIRDILSYYLKNDRLQTHGKFHYSNVGYQLLGRIIQLYSDRMLAEYLQKEIFNRAQMSNTFLAPTDELLFDLGYLAHQPQIPSGIKVIEKQVHQVEYSKVEGYMLAAGGILSTAQDLLKWPQALWNGHILAEKNLKTMLTPHTDSPGYGNIAQQYGYGVFIGENGSCGTQKIISHGGNLTGYTSFIAWVPELKISIVILSNINHLEYEPFVKKSLDILCEDQSL